MIWRDSPKKINRYMTWAGLFIGIFSEIGQLAGIFPGTFDWLDLVLNGIASLLAIVILQSYQRRNNNA
jgi:hypothetical protein